MKFVDFFAGIGGIRLGLERAGHECVGFCEWDKFARQSYKAMYETEGEWENNDIRTAESYGIPKADLWTFGFPCQDLSVAGKRKGLQEGERSGLFYEIVRLLQGLRQEDRPKWLLAENVKGLFSAGRGFDFLRCVLELGGLGYNIQYQLLNSKDFGVPQNRERVFIIGCLGDGSGREVFPLRRTDGENPCTSEEQRPIRLGNIYGEDRGTGYAGNVWDKHSIAPTLTTMAGGNREPMILDNYGLASAVAIDMTENKPAITDNVRFLKARYTAGITNRSGDNSGVLVKPVLTPDRAEKQQNGRRIKEDGEPMFTLTAQDRHGVAIIDEQNKCFRKDGNIGTLTTDGSSPKHNNRIAIIGGLQEHQKVRTDGVSPCLTQAMGMGGGQTPCILGTRIRKLTPRECWRLQGFPDEKFDKAVAAGVSNSQLYRQAGNAVSVPVAQAIGERLKQIELCEDTNN